MADKKNILIVEDEELIAMAIGDDLADLGNPLSAPTEGEALALLRDNNVHFAIVDYHLRKGTSREVIALLQRRGVPFVVCTGSSPEVEGGALDGLSRLPKPYLADDLRRLVSAALYPVQRKPTVTAPAQNSSLGGLLDAARTTPKDVLI